jgi:transposase-like protein
MSRSKQDADAPTPPQVCFDEEAAVEYCEQVRWGNRPTCPHCLQDDVYKMKDRETGTRNKRFLWRCRRCSKHYSVRWGTVLQDSGIQLSTWCRALWESSRSPYGLSPQQLSKCLGITRKTAKFVIERVSQVNGFVENQRK